MLNSAKFPRPLEDVVVDDDDDDDDVDNKWIFSGPQSCEATRLRNLDPYARET